MYPDDFDLDLIRQFVSNLKAKRGLSNGLSATEILELRHLGEIKSGVFKPNVACTLLFAKDPNRRFPGCKIRFLRFEGDHEGSGEHFNPIKDIWIEGSI